jgi:hypothetical protein
LEPEARIAGTPGAALAGDVEARADEGAEVCGYDGTRIWRVSPVVSSSAAMTSRTLEPESAGGTGGCFFGTAGFAG